MHMENATCSANASFEITELYSSHWQRVRRWVTRLGGPTIDVEDTVQDVFLAAYQQRTRFRGDSRLSTWLYGISIRVVSKARRSARSRASLARCAVEMAGDFASHSPTPIDQLEQRQTRALVHEVLDRLQVRHRNVLNLYAMEGRSGEEIARITGQSPATVWVQLHRARAAFARQLESLEQGAGAGSGESIELT
jgi:RNA polymerase sigma-70 factor (ECF subfamily)